MLKEIKKEFKKKSGGARGFMIRLGVFLITFTLSSTFYQNYKELLDQYHIKVEDSYSSLIFYFMIAVFVMLRWDKIKKLYPYKNKFTQTAIFSILAIISFSLPSTLFAFNFHLSQMISFFLLFGLGQFFIFLAVFNLPFFLKTFNEEVLTMILIALGYVAMPLLVEEYWTYVLIPIKQGVVAILHLFTTELLIDTSFKDYFIIQMNDFRGAIGPACSGIYSMIAFTFLFITSLAFQPGKVKIDKLKATLALISGIIILYLLNIFRIAAIIIIGDKYSPELAMTLFHEYLGTIFLMTIFIIYLYYIVPKVQK
jgi:exosortase/archaeosortase family protein